MKVFLIIFTTCLCIKHCVLLNKNENLVEMPDTTIPTEIISNYLSKYFSQEKVFLSLCFSSSNSDQKYFQEKLITSLITRPKINEFSYNILGHVHQFRRRNRNVFNVIFVDTITSLT